MYVYIVWSSKLGASLINVFCIYFTVNKFSSVICVFLSFFAMLLENYLSDSLLIISQCNTESGVSFHWLHCWNDAFPQSMLYPLMIYIQLYILGCSAWLGYTADAHGVTWGRWDFSFYYVNLADIKYMQNKASLFSYLPLIKFPSNNFRNHVYR